MSSLLIDAADILRLLWRHIWMMRERIDRYYSLRLMLLGLTAAVFGIVLVLAGLVDVLIEAFHPNNNGGLAVVEILALLGPIAAGVGLATAYVAAMSPENPHTAREEV